MIFLKLIILFKIHERSRRVWFLFTLYDQNVTQKIRFYSALNNRTLKNTHISPMCLYS